MSVDTARRSMMFDFFGELLTDKQREYFDLHYNEDFSLAEIAEQTGTSRQAVWDTIRRADATLREMEEKTGVVSRFLDMQRTLMTMEKNLSELLPLTSGRAWELTNDLIRKVADLSKQ